MTNPLQSSTVFKKDEAGKVQIDISNPLAIKLLKKTFESDMIVFGKFFMPRLFGNKTPKFHKEIAELLMNGVNKIQDKNFKEIIRNAVIVPRGHAKTTIAVTLFLIWAIVHRKFKYAMHITNTLGLATQNLSLIASELMTNDLLKRFYYPNNDINGGIWNREEIECFIPDENNRMTKCMVKAFGMGTELRGTKYDGYRPDLALLDDLENKEQVASKDQRAKTKSWYEGDVAPCFGENGLLCNIGTILHHDSILNNIKDNVNDAYKDYYVVEYKAIYQDDDGNDFALWEDRKPLTWLYAERERLTATGQGSDFSKEYMNTPVSDSERVFKDEVIMNNLFVLSDLMVKVNKKEKKLHVTMGIDTAISMKERADFSAIVVLGTDQDGMRYVLDAWKGKVPSIEVTDKVFELYRQYSPRVVAMQKAGIDQLYKSNFEERMRKEHLFFTIRPALYATKSGNSKEERIKGSLESVFNSNSMKLQQKQINLIQELVQFPNGLHDDLLDALQIAFSYSMVPKDKQLAIADMNKQYHQNFYKHF